MRILVVVLLAALSTAASLIEPLIYRVAVNDVAGLFVGHVEEENLPEESETSSAAVTYLQPAVYHVAQEREHTLNPREKPAQKNTRRRGHNFEPHRRDYVAPALLRKPSTRLFGPSDYSSASALLVISYG
jgi:hypothetical protein